MTNDKQRVARFEITWAMVKCAATNDVMMMSVRKFGVCLSAGAGMGARGDMVFMNDA